MKVSELIPSQATVSNLQDIEKRLELRRYRSRWGGLFAIAAAVFQVAVALRVPWDSLAHPFSKALLPLYATLHGISL
jgi:hypothetical protein